MHADYRSSLSYHLIYDERNKKLQIYDLPFTPMPKLKADASGWNTITVNITNFTILKTAEIAHAETISIMYVIWNLMLGPGKKSTLIKERRSEILTSRMRFRPCKLPCPNHKLIINDYDKMYSFHFYSYSFFIIAPNNLHIFYKYFTRFPSILDNNIRINKRFNGVRTYANNVRRFLV